MSRALSPSFARCYGLARVARVRKISRASVYRSLKQMPPTTMTCRPGPVGACSDAELADHIRRQIDASRLHGEGHRKLWARLRFAGARASPRRVRRMMRETGLLAPHRVGRTAAKPHDGTITTDKVNEMWGTDMTQTITIREGRAKTAAWQSGLPFFAASSSPWNTPTRKSLAFMHRGRPIASRPWSRSGRACIGASEPSRPGWRVD